MNPLMEKYHDEEFGVPVFDDQKIFEMLVLELNQAGLSWQTILNKRENFRQAFGNFDIQTVADFTPEQVEILVQDAGIIRHRGKIQAAIVNAQQILIMEKEYGSFQSWLWDFCGGKVIDHHFQTTAEIPSFDKLAVSLSKELKKRGFKFVGPTTMYSFLQAVGIYNDHVVTCFRYGEV
ncbi:DNA-3-methyladenine glycosylase I [Enterococcus timonensis]|uniref:DNA-3-methyladenine glycosylase I n=1 Tax=Enterococcus timonensis TaxID=1852364 RepID=UPI002E26A81F